MDILTVAQRYVTLKKRGANYWGLSPFKAERTPSFSVNTKKGIYKCFSTGNGGSATKLVMELEQLTYPEALRRMAEWANIDIPTSEFPQERERLDRRRNLLALCRFIQQYCTSRLEGSPAAQHLEERGVPPIYWESFMYGYADPGLVAACRTMRFSDDDLAAVGFKPTQRGFVGQGRLVIPICDAGGRPIGFGLRLLEGDGPKYLNSPEGELYHKGEVLYNLHRAKPASVLDDRIVLVEGYFHVSAWLTAGYSNVVASCGTALTPGQVAILARTCRTVVLAYDSDMAGVAATLKAARQLLEAGMEVLFSSIGDADDALRAHGASHVADHYREASFVPELARILGLESDKPDVRAMAMREIGAIVSLVRDPATHQVSVEQAHRMGVPLALLGSSGHAPEGQASSTAVRANPEAALRLLAGILVSEPDFEMPDGRTAKAHIVDVLGGYEPRDRKMLSVWPLLVSDEPIPEELSETVASLMLPQHYPAITPQLVTQAIAHLSYKHLDYLMGQNKAIMATADEQQIEVLHRRQQQLRQLRDIARADLVTVD
jgi:DNA primase